MANPYDVYVAGQDGSINQGLSGVFGALQRKNKMIAQNALNAQASEIFQSGTPEEISSFMIANPSAQNQIISADKFLNERTKQSKLNAARDIAMGVNPQQALSRSAQEIQAEGGNPQDTIAMTNQPPEIQKAASEKLWASMDPQGYKAWKGSQPESMTEYQRATVESKRIDQELRREENAIKMEKIAAQKETDELKKQQLEQSIQERQQKTEQLKRDKFKGYEDSITTIDDTIDTVDRLLAPDSGLESAAGIGANFPTISGSEAANFEKQLETLQSQAFLSQVEKLKGLGALSENEGKKLASAIGSLSVDMSDKALTRELKRIKSTLDRTKSNLEKNKPQGYKKQQTQILSDEDLLKKYGA